MAALARGRTLLQESIIVGNARMLKPGAPSVPSSILLRKNQIGGIPPQQQIGMGRMLSTFCNSSLTGLQSNTLLQPGNSVSLSFERHMSTTQKKSGVYLLNEVDLSQVKFGAAKKNARGGTFIPIHYNQGTLRVQTAVTRIPFGLTSFENASGFSVNVAFDNYETNKELKKFYDFIQKFDDVVLKNALGEKTKEWFSGKSLIPQVIEANFNRNIREPKDIKYSPIMKYKIPVYNGNPDIEVFLDTEPVTMEALTANAMIAAIIEPRSVWFVNNKFGVTWTIRQAKIVEAAPEQTKLTSYSFRDSDITYTKRTDSVSPNPPPPVEIADEAEELEELEEEEVEVPKKSAPVKAVPTKLTSKAIPVKKVEPAKPAATATAAKVVSKTQAMPIKSSTSPKKK